MKDRIQLPPTGDDSERIVRRILSDTFTDYKGERSQLAEELSVRAGRRISCSMLNAFAAPSNETARFPASLIVALSDITGDERLQRFCMGPRLRLLIEFAERSLAGVRDQRELEVLREKLLESSATHGRTT